MILKVSYNKTTKEIQIENDIELIDVELNENTIIDNDDELSFEIAISTTEYENSNNQEGGEEWQP